ncbi:hypothetical protein KO527_23685 [Pseudoalteromonas sp. C2R02]|uniref:alpha/beta hydrolase-fold protein n=1 Tax=Pseudoalteromonas sp. C2R02 TaxID=2841565 RepID=UPI001C0A4469|nr:alpha/beta hydrolase-fold protein [Pseudoalteromonas sp. C2R02]MBU2972342.1 hypothetical protein [Pseudoalteromonas sp. C2R02]
MRLNQLALITSLSFLPLISNAQTSINPKGEIKGEEVSYKVGERFIIKSTILNEERQLLIHLPDDYNKSDKSYPVIFVLDGNSHFRHATVATNILEQQNRMPQSIIVAIPNNQGTRGRDLGAQKDIFLKFISDEVIPYTNKNYRTSNHKTIFGHSMAGAFVIKALASKPDLFENYIAASPYMFPNDKALFTAFDKLFKNKQSLNKSLYLTMTDVAAEGVEVTQALDKFVDLMKKQAPESLNWHYEFIPEQVHMTTPYLTLYQGASFVFSDYHTPIYTQYSEFDKNGGIKGLQKFYEKRSAKYQVSAQIPERTIRRLGYNFMEANPKEAVEIFLQNSRSNPESPGAKLALARGYENLGSKDKALSSFKEAVKIAQKTSPQNVPFLQNQVERYQKLIAE